MKKRAKEPFFSDKEEVLRFLKEEAKNGSAEAALYLAQALKWGMLGEENPRRAAALYRRLCRSEDPRIASHGFYGLGLMYYHGYENFAMDSEKRLRYAFSCFLQSALKYPNSAAFYRLGDMYRYGQYVEENLAIACSLYLKANG